MAKMSSRAQLRAERLVEAAESLNERIEAEPNSPKVGRWRRRLAEYQESLDNLQKFGMENPPPDAGVVEIDVPATTFRHAKHAPNVGE